jgi:hypothetical protein
MQEIKPLISYTKQHGFLKFAPNIILTIFFSKVSFDSKINYTPHPHPSPPHPLSYIIPYFIIVGKHANSFL